MKLLLLGAGYGTRLYPLTRNKAKPLLDVAGIPMIERIIDRFADADGIEEILLVTNHRFAADFEAWAAGYTPPFGGRVRIFDDGTIDNATKLGAIGDIQFVIERAALDDDVVVVAGDNLFDRSLAPFVAAGREQGALIGVYDVGDLEMVRKYNHIVVDDDDRVVEFEEKPAEPRSTLTAICLYYLPRKTLGLVRRYLDEGNNPDAPGYYIQWLHKQMAVHIWRVGGTWFDIGDKDSYYRANKAFGAPAGGDNR